jgi:hypothetical protein
MMVILPSSAAAQEVLTSEAKFDGFFGAFWCLEIVIGLPFLCQVTIGGKT